MSRCCPPIPRTTSSVTDPNYNASLVFKVTPAMSMYATYNYSKNISGAVGNGGGITGWDTSTGDALDKENFQQPSEAASNSAPSTP